ncbi:hypothetical protein T440DRAFT_550955 [Plenodomus tracheiphilus IPT5]|uniref:Uncharacterized protein n=1 Tax=Plenodomus tracheiphilus IPT5 TaxID=1408161 RepID=A0A6A7BN75_9PLEO|nr:hypothetical protein T440DRAFT_550955 [Plenodomus tracheiphilus IPT5]
MSTGEDDDLKLQRASAALLSDFRSTLPRLLWTRSHGSATAQVRQHVREGDMHKACGLIEPFQEDPQILDTHLKSFIPPLVAAFLEVIQLTSEDTTKKGFVPLPHAICCILNVFCKVRGEKVIKGFFNNEPRYLEPILNQLEASQISQAEGGQDLGQASVRPWVERHILLLWLSHLLLAPFPLDSMSALESSADTSKALEVQFPDEIPGISLRVLTICLDRLQSASKERSAAANLLVRLCVRPDMQKLGLLHAMVDWSLSFFSKISGGHADIHQCLGVLSFLSGLVVSATNEEIGPNLAAIYQSCRRILDDSSLEFVRSSAVARKLIVKTLRTIVIHCLQATSPPSGLDPTAVLEEVIEFLLEALADGDTPVRYGASKALSIITLKLDAEMAGEVVEAILGSLTESIYWQGSKRNLNSVNPLRWHGLTLTLSQLLYRKAISNSHLPDVLNALLLSLSFEQRSPTGGSVGTNVRDAACFGIWALSRRYPTADLLAVDTAAIRASEHQRSLHVPQVLAIELVIAACLDPAGNIRRGSSAALQELIGRHPNTIEEGIPLVQIVDFHAVGLRQRAMCEVAVKAGELQPLYWEALFENLLEWRGTGSLDSDSRLFAAKAVGLLSVSQPPSSIIAMSEELRLKLASLRPREVEERQGLVTTLAALINSAKSLANAEDRRQSCEGLVDLWKLLDEELNLEDKAFSSSALRPGFTAASICSFIGALSSMTIGLPTSSRPQVIPASKITRLLNLSLARDEEAVLEAISDATPSILQVLCTIDDADPEGLISAWLNTLENETSYSGRRYSGQAVALGASYGTIASWENNTMWYNLQNRIVKLLTFRCTAAVAVEARTVALRALGTLLSGSLAVESTSHSYLAADAEAQIGSALHVALNDYTITERGDVGSLVRLEALATVRCAWQADRLHDQDSEAGHKLYANVLRLSLEKLDKMRVTAAQVLQDGPQRGRSVDTILPADDVSSPAYFLTALTSLQGTTNPAIREAISTGYVNSAGMGSESVVQNARVALLDFIDMLPTSSTAESSDTPFSLFDFATCLTQLLRSNLENDRVLLPLLEILAFLFDMHILQRLQDTSFNFRTLLSLTQKSHFKSTHMQKLHLALDVYRGLGGVAVTRRDTLAKVMSMLLHPFPKVRITAAETLWLLTGEEGLKRHDWSLPSKSLKGAVDGMKEGLVVEAVSV